MFGMSVWHFKFSRALIAALFLSSMGILVYMFVTSIEQSKMSLAKVMSSMVFMKWVESLMYDGRSLTACLSQWSRNLEMLEVTLLTHEQMGLYACGFLCSLMRKYIRLVLWSSGGRQNL